MILTKETMEKKIYLIKCGFTLIEVMASIAIFSIVFISISSFILFNVNLETKNSLNNKKLTFIKSSMEILNSKEDSLIFNKYNNKNVCFFFSDLEELENNMNNDNKKEINYVDINSVKASNKEKKKYGLVLYINKETVNSKETKDKDVNIFFVKSQIWDLSHELDNSIIKEMYISR